MSAASASRQIAFTDGGMVSPAASGGKVDSPMVAKAKIFITEHTLEELTSFENRGYKDLVNGEEKTVKIFPDVDNRFKFGFFKLIKGRPTPEGHCFDGRFYLHHPADVSSEPIQYSVALMRRFSPQNLSLMEFRSAEIGRAHV